MWTYLIINFLIILFPFILSFESKIKYYKNYRALFISILIVGLGFVVWDIIATYFHHWSFNSDYILGKKIFGLPFEEILFFITVPYSCIFIFEALCFYLQKDRFGIADIKSKLFHKVLLFIGFISILLSIIFRSQYYTSTLFLFFGVTIFVIERFYPSLFRSHIYWMFIALTYIPFFVVNYFLTSKPVVLYHQNAILGIRVTTIPVEDFIYSFSMLTLYLFVYLKFKKVKISL
jgi:lycopene cyclase domain-containing protein